jgi:TRAP-type C4-dicarboxylate transport system substrate-binding protein
VSLTSHVWAGFNLIAHLKLWQRLPADVQAVIERNAAKFVGLQRADNEALNAELRGRLAQQGMIFNEPDTAPFRARLGSFYARWKDGVGQRAWSLLEAHVGKLA